MTRRRLSAVPTQPDAVPPDGPPSTLYCEQCGTAQVLGEAVPGPGRAPVLLTTCPGCDLLTCARCWEPDAASCAACAARRAADPPASRRGFRATRPLAIVLALGVVSAVAVVGLTQLLAGGQRPPPGSVAAETATATPGSSAAPAGGPSVTPAAGTPAVSSAPGDTAVRVTVVDRMATAWADGAGEVRAHVVVAVQNDGAGPLRLPSSTSRYEVLSADGIALADGVFAYAFPDVIDPGERAYLIDTISAIFIDPDDVTDVTIEVAAEAAAGPADGAGLVVRDIEADTDDAGLVVRGVVENGGPGEVGSVVVAVIVRDEAGRLLAGAYDLADIRDLVPGATAAFETDYPGAPSVTAVPVLLEGVATVPRAP